MFSVALTGPIAAGKSAATRRLRELGAHVIDYDQLARDLTAPRSPLVHEVAAAFPGVVSDGVLDRARLAALVFNNEEALAELNSITHPAIRAAAAAEDKRLVREDGTAIVVHDIPLLVETGQAAAYPFVLVVTAPEELRIQRMMDNRGMTRAAAQARIDSQADDLARAEAADHLIVNDRSTARLDREVDRAFHRIRTMGRVLRGAATFTPIRTSAEAAKRTARKLTFAGQPIDSVGMTIRVPHFDGPALISAGCIAVRRGWYRADPYAAVEITR